MKEKRIGPDTVINIISNISLVSWIILGLIFLLLAISNPTSSGMSASRPALRGTGKWATSVIFMLLVFLEVLSISGILFNVTRLKRKNDRLRLTLVFSGILAAIGIIIISIR